MSFGAAAQRRGPTDEALCPCGSGSPFGVCCRPLLARGLADTAESLMRSRYTAFSVGDARYLLATWHPTTRPDRLELDPDIRWTGLEILDTQRGGERDATGVVEFRAHWRTPADRGVLHERSRFTRPQGAWMCVDGVVE